MKFTLAAILIALLTLTFANSKLRSSNKYDTTLDNKTNLQQTSNDQGSIINSNKLPTVNEIVNQQQPKINPQIGDGKKNEADPSISELSLQERLFINAKQAIEECKIAMSNAENSSSLKKKEAIKKPEFEIANEVPNGRVELSLPPPKLNKFALLNLNKGPVTLFFDFLDNAILPIIRIEMEAIFEKARQAVPASSVEYKNPFSPFIKDEFTAQSKKLDLDKIKMDVVRLAVKNFDETIYKKSVSAAQLYTILKNWNWFMEMDISKQVYDLMMKFDFNGDGVLNAKEFFIVLINVNKNFFSLCQGCLNKTVTYAIDPIFDFVDCNGDEFIDVAEVWEGLEYLQRISVESLVVNTENEQINKITGLYGADLLKPDAGGILYSIYNCRINGEPYWTNAVNDFFLKSMKGDNHKMNKYVWRKYILLTYVERLVDERGDIKASIELSNKGKNDRWSTPSGIDKLCPI